MADEPLDPRLIPHIRRVVTDLAAGNWEGLAADGRLGRCTAKDLSRVLREYFARVIAPPDEIREHVHVYRYNNGSGFGLDVFLWTAEEGKSDLCLRLDASFERDDFRVSIVDLLVP